MASTIVTKNSSTASAVPVSGDLTQGELAVNVTDKRLFTKNSGGTVVELGTNPASLALPNGTTNGVAYLNGSKVVTTGSALTFDGTNMGIGVAASAFGGGTTTLSIKGNGATTTKVGAVYFKDAGGTDAGAHFLQDDSTYGFTSWNAMATGNFFRWAIGALGSEAMRLTSTGLGIGTSSPTTKLSITDSTGPIVRLVRTSNRFELSADTDFMSLNARDASTYITFKTADTERARIDSSGNLLVGATSGVTTEKVNFTQTADGPALIAVCSNSTLSANGVVYVRAARNTTNNSFYAYSYYNTGASAFKFVVADSGNVTNTNGSYGTISDAKMKTDIVDAGSQWTDIKSIRFRKFKMKDDPAQVVQLGVVAQEVEQTSPGLVEEHVDKDSEGNNLGTTTKSVKTSVLLMKAAVALQEAMARIEQLEADVAALKGA
jgi:hypothetical protein